MAWTAPRTWVVNEVVTAAIMNTHVRDNFNQTGPAIVTTAGDILYATAANALARLGIGSTDQVLTVVAGAPGWAANQPTISGTSAWYIPPFGYPQLSTGQYLCSANNKVSLLRFSPTVKITVATIAAVVGQAAVGGKIGFGIYNAGGSSLLADSGIVDASTTGTKAVTLGSAVTLSPGTVYLAAMTTNDRANVWGTALVYNALVDGGTAQFLEAANASSGGQLPATTGALSAYAALGPAIKLNG